MMRRVGLTVIALMVSASTAAVAQKTQSGPEGQQPTGWIGLLLQFYQMQSGDSLNYPTVLSVEGNSPASRAGFMVGDTIVSYDKIDARGDPADLVKLLIPNRKIAFQYRRNGVHTTQVTVAKRHTVYLTFNDRVTEVPPRSVEGQPNVVTFQFRMVPGVPVPIVSPLGARTDVPVAGASVTRMNEGLATAMRIANAGILVIDVAAETPAAAAGIREGDVIVSADGMATNTVQAILQAIQAKSVKGEKSVGLEVLRKGKKQRLSLKW